MEQVRVICERNPTITYDDHENEFYDGLGERLSAVGFFIGEWAICVQGNRTGISP
ncbi:hypothetical protein EZS27_014233 [termite gut metagenome]|uniref:Uncharacterized protein n=1 Tax=termite gut metagenome TaxID=433724 RepID=A0A5J4RXL6_9ZZZZ